MAFALKLTIPPAIKRALDSPRVAALFRPDYPPFVVEVGSRRLVSVGLDRGKQGLRLERSRVIDLPPGLVEPSLQRPALGDVKAFAELLRQAVDGIPGFEGRMCLLLPDRVAKVSFVDLETLAPTRGETMEIIRWKLKRATPFRVEDGRMSYQLLGPVDGGYRAIVILVQAQVVEQFEQAAAMNGYELGLIDLSSLNLWNLLHDASAPTPAPAPGGAPAPGDELLVSISEDHATTIIGRGGQPLFVRCKAPVGAEPLRLEEVQQELHPTILYYQDRLGGAGLSRAVVRAPLGMAAAVVETLATRYGIAAVRLEAARLAALPGLEGLEPEHVSLLLPSLGAALGR